jgi:hypothetical protein
MLKDAVYFPIDLCSVTQNDVSITFWRCTKPELWWLGREGKDNFTASTFYPGTISVHSDSDGSGLKAYVHV